MSRNLCRTDCCYCGSEVRTSGPIRQLREFHSGWEDAIDGSVWMWDARCSACHAHYLAWAHYPSGGDSGGMRSRPFVDLSFFSTFNNEPGPDDEPSGVVTVKRSVYVDDVLVHEDVIDA